MEKRTYGKADTRTWIHRFVDRKTAVAFAKQKDAKVESCPTTGTNKDGYFKYMVVTCGK